MSKPIAYRWVILGACWAAFMVAFVQRLSLSPLAPFMQEDLELSSTQIGSLMAASAFGYMVMQPPAGWLADRLGVRKMLLVGQVSSGVFILGMVFASTFTSGLLVLALAGLGSGTLLSATNKGLLLWFPPQERATAMGLKQTSINIGGLAVAAALPSLALAFGWRSGYLSVGLTSLFLAVVTSILYRDPSETAPALGNRAPSSTGAVGDILRNRDLWLLSLAGMAFAGVQSGSATHLVLFLKGSLFISAVVAGWYLALTQGAGAFGKPLVGLASDRLFNGRRKPPLMLLGLAIASTSLVVGFLPPGTSFWLLIPLLGLFGLGATGWAGVLFTLVGELTDRELVGTATGLSNTILSLGSTLSPPLFGLIVDSTGSYSWAWAFLAAWVALGLVSLSQVRERSSGS